MFPAGSRSDATRPAPGGSWRPGPRTGSNSVVSPRGPSSWPWADAAGGVGVPTSRLHAARARTNSGRCTRRPGAPARPLPTSRGDRATFFARILRIGAAQPLLGPLPGVRGAVEEAGDALQPDLADIPLAPQDGGDAAQRPAFGLAAMG